MRNAFTFIQQSKKNASNDDPFEGVAIGCLIILFLLIVGVIGAFILIIRGNDHSKAMEEKIHTLQEKIREQKVSEPEQRAALEEIYPFPNPNEKVNLL